MGIKRRWGYKEFEVLKGRPGSLGGREVGLYVLAGSPTQLLRVKNMSERRVSSAVLAVKKLF